MFTQSDIHTVFNPPQTVEARIWQAIPMLFEEPEEEKPGDNRFYKYRFDPMGYIEKYLGWSPWDGGKSIGQLQITEYYRLALVKQYERQLFELGKLDRENLEYHIPGETIENWISIDAGHAVGKTFLLAGLVSHFFDCFQPSIIYCFAPEWPQINDLLFKDIRTQREGRGLPGDVLARQPRINYKPNHFVTGRSTAHSKTERIHGQHSVHMMFAVDEAEGIQKFVFDSIRSMASGGLAIILIVRNPQTTDCQAHQLRTRSDVKDLTISCLNTPNMIQDKDVIPGMARRDYAISMLESHADIVNEHDKDAYTFEIPWNLDTIYEPQQEFLWRVLGIASENQSINTFCPYGRYDSAVERGQNEVFEFTDEHDKATFGVDAARYGGDFGTVYIHRADWLWRTASFQTSDSMTFYTHIKTEMEKLVADGVVHIEVRIDAGGGWGAGVIDLLNYDLELKYRNMSDPRQIKSLMEYTTTREQREHIKEAVAMREAQEDNKWDNLIEFRVVEVNFDGVPTKGRDYLNLATEMYYHLGASMQRMKVRNAPKSLRSDVCARAYGWGMRKGYSVKTLTSKESFRKEHNRSPDDGDGAALAVAPSHILRLKPLLLPAG